MPVWQKQSQGKAEWNFLKVCTIMNPTGLTRKTKQRVRANGVHLPRSELQKAIWG